MCPVAASKYSSHGLRFRGWSNEASARRHFNRHHEGKLHAGRAALPRVTMEQRKAQMRKASQAYRDRKLIKRRRANVARMAERRFPDKAGFLEEGRRAPILQLPPGCRASMLVHGHRVGLLEVVSLGTYHALNEVGHQMRQFRRSVLLRLHPDKLGSASEEERQAAEEAFKEISPKLQQGIFWYQTAELRAAREYQGWVTKYASPVDNGHKRNEFIRAHEELIRGRAGGTALYSRSSATTSQDNIAKARQ
ncbi:hypothetical protein WJX74_003231 [Apatococcus lobatus]|uniref:J domain-containing protein n=1 Tax=Apatococcus lobatus TaxID=904363 RepID=A0AAW1RIS1_9CHLO